MTVLCFGNLQCDLLCSTLTTLPPLGGIRMIDRIEMALSGNAANVALALARVGVPVAFAGYFGNDVIGDQFLATLHEEGVDLRYLIRHPVEGTGISIVTLAPSGERSVFFVNGCNNHINLSAVSDDMLAMADIVSVGSVNVLPQFTGDAVAQLFARAKKHNAITILNTHYDSLGRGYDFLAPALAHTDYFVLNEVEGRQLTGERDPESILRWLANRNSVQTILTLAEQGACYLSTTSEVVVVPALPVNAVDSTGAGDTFIAGVIAGLVNQRSMHDCVRLGCYLASFAVTGSGSYERIPKQQLNFDQILTTH